MSRPRRTHAEARLQMREGIVRLGNAQLESVGAAALSVRQIARDLGVASSAIYRHVASRDELLTILLVDAYVDLARAALSHHTPDASDAERFRALARGMRGWGVAHPDRWALLYGSPVPGYAAPAEHTGESGTRVLLAFATLLSRGTLPADWPATGPSEGLRIEYAAISQEFGVTADPSLVSAVLGAWTALLGQVSAEVFGQLGAEMSQHAAELMERWIDSTLTRFRIAES